EREVARLVGIQRRRVLRALDVAEPAAPGADVPHHHDGGRPAAPALAHVGAEALLADGVQLQLLERLPDFLVGGAGREPHLEPFRLGLSPPAVAGRTEANQILRHRAPPHMCSVSPETANAASPTASESVGWGWMVLTRSSLVASRRSAAQASAIRSVACGPTMCTPRTSSYFASATILTRPVSPMIRALPLAENGNLPTRTS